SIAKGGPVLIETITSARARSALIICIAALVSAECSNNSSPTSPSSTPPKTQPPTTSGAVTVAINPNPVPFSGQPVTDTPSCAGLKNTWYYDQVFRETGGSAVTFTSRVDSFDGFSVNNLTGLNIVVPANGTLTLHARWCSGNATTHVAQSTFSG